MWRELFHFRAAPRPGVSQLPAQTRLVGTLSGGEQQMLAMGRGLMSRPERLLLNEPSMGLAPIPVEKINEQGTSILLVEHNAHMALSVANRGYLLERGRIVLEGRAAELGENAQVRGRISAGDA